LCHGRKQDWQRASCQTTEFRDILEVETSQHTPQLEHPHFVQIPAPTQIPALNPVPTPAPPPTIYSDVNIISILHSVINSRSHFNFNFTFLSSIQTYQILSIFSSDKRSFYRIPTREFVMPRSLASQTGR
jgi:hypothetical protein